LLPTTFKLGLFTCLRLGELINIKYSDIKEYEGHRYLKAIDRKAAQLIGDSQSVRIKHVTLIVELLEVLNNECDLKDPEGEDEYIIAPELKRSTVKDIITKGFTHFRRVAGINEEKCFKDLRKTYISIRQIKYGDIGLTALISGHSNQEVTRKHYLNQKDAVRKSSGFRVFKLD
jgi:integrase